MKKILLTTVLTALVFTYVGYIIGLSKAPACTRKHLNHLDDGRIVLIPVDTIDGRPTYNVLFSDEDGFEAMYAEEVLVGLTEGKWNYDEDATITRKKK